VAKVSPKLEILVDLERPVEEIKSCIAAIVNCHPDKQLEILREVELWMGETIEKLEKYSENKA